MNPSLGWSAGFGAVHGHRETSPWYRAIRDYFGSIEKNAKIEKNVKKNLDFNSVGVVGRDAIVMLEKLDLVCPFLAQNFKIW